MSGGKTKGVGFINVRAFVVERHGDEGWARVLAELSPGDGAELRAMIAMGWYSLALYARLIRAVEQLFGQARSDIIVELGRYEAERDLTTTHRLFLRFFDHAYVVEKTAAYWRRMHDTGTWTIVPDGKRGLTGTLLDWGYVDESLCRELVGYMARCLELTGARDVVVEHPRCRGRGASECRFHASYDAR